MRTTSCVRTFIATACAVASFMGCSGSQEMTSPPAAETLNVSNISPADGSVISQTFAVYPMAAVTFVASVVSSKTGAVSNVSFVLDDSLVTGQKNVMPGVHTLVITATAPSGMVLNKQSSFTVSQANIACKAVSVSPNGVDGAEYVPQGMPVLFGPTGAEDTVKVGANGDCSMNTKYALTSNVQVATRGDQNTVPFLAHVPSQFLNSLTIVLVPKMFTIPSGAYSGQVIPIDLEKVYAPVPTSGNISFFLRFNNGNGWNYDIGSWARLPIKVACVSSASNVPISARIAAQCWTNADSLNKMFGNSLFVLSTEAEVKSTAGITAVVKSTFTNASGGTDNWGAGDYVVGGMNFPDTLSFAEQTIFWHEMLHALGDGHTCSWNGEQGGGYCTYINPPYPVKRDVQPEDVAYTLLMFRVRSLERKYNTRFSLAYDHQGQRVFTFGLPEEVVIYSDGSGALGGSVQ